MGPWCGSWFTFFWVIDGQRYWGRIQGSAWTDQNGEMFPRPIQRRRSAPAVLATRPGS